MPLKRGLFLILVSICLVLLYLSSFFCLCFFVFFVFLYFCLFFVGSAHRCTIFLCCQFRRRHRNPVLFVLVAKWGFGIHPSMFDGIGFQVRHWDSSLKWMFLGIIQLLTLNSPVDLKCNFSVKRCSMGLDFKWGIGICPWNECSLGLSNF